MSSVIMNKYTFLTKDIPIQIDLIKYKNITERLSIFKK